MKASQLVLKLLERIAEHGDLVVATDMEYITYVKHETDDGEEERFRIC